MGRGGNLKEFLEQFIAALTVHLLETLMMLSPVCLGLEIYYSELLLCLGFRDFQAKIG